MQVVELMKTKLVVASPTDSVAAAWRLLRQHQIRHLPVVEERKLVGIVTDRDIRLVVPSALTSGRREQDPHDALEKIAVREIMTGQVVTVAPEASIANVARLLLERRIGGLPVVQGSRLVGIITKTDILAAFVDVVEGESQ